MALVGKSAPGSARRGACTRQRASRQLISTFIGQAVVEEGAHTCNKLGPAHAAGTSIVQGSLVPGTFADFVVWDNDPLTTSGSALLNLRVRATFVGGERVYQPDE